MCGDTGRTARNDVREPQRGDVTMSSTYELIGQIINPRSDRRAPAASRIAATTDVPLHELIGWIVGPPCPMPERRTAKAA
ncbi:MAG: hypothetical protein ACOC2T_04040 [Planctomycetota bacterium]